jgi:NADPH:quinone reductase-like Zn-dependent oxidoreductase
MAFERVMIERFGDVDEVKVVTVEEMPEPGPGEVLVRVLRSGVAFTDVMIRKGMYPELKGKPPLTLGYDMVGVVEKLGPGVEMLGEGDLVADMTVVGGHSQYLCRTEESLVPIPEGVDPTEVAALVLPYMTAYQMFNWLGAVEKDSPILIHGGGGAVGRALLEMGKIFTAKMFATDSKRNFKRIEEFGATPIDYENEDFVEVIRSKTEKGVAAAFDAVGFDNFKRSFKCLKPGGKLIAYGFYENVMGKGHKLDVLQGFLTVKLWHLLPNKKKAYFYSIGGFRKKSPELFKQDLTILFHLLKAGKIKPLIDSVIPMADVAKAHRKIETGEAKGKIVVKCNDK